MKKTAEPTSHRVCAWRTGTAHCRMRPSGAYCSWHSYWLRLVEQGNLGRQQQEEFFEWWEQFQPYGTYSDQPGPWWADKDLLWAAIIGKQDPPPNTQEIQHEVMLRRLDVLKWRNGTVLSYPATERIRGLPLPCWHEEEINRRICSQCEVR